MELLLSGAATRIDGVYMLELLVDVPKSLDVGNVRRESVQQNKRGMTTKCSCRSCLSINKGALMAVMSKRNQSENKS